MKRIGIIVVLLFSVVASYGYVPSTSRDYEPYAVEITKGCDSDYEKAKAIYMWLAANIAYDTSYTIYHADQCWDNRKGVCMAYSELFYLLGTAVGLDVKIVFGDTREYKGHVLSDGGHAWNSVIDRQTGEPILVDACWGAGYVSNGVFVFEDGDMSWFDVAPECMIFTHFPDASSDQHLSVPVKRQQFLFLPRLNPIAGHYGVNVKKLLKLCLGGNTDIPQFYGEKLIKHKLIQIPLIRNLGAGHAYKFVIKSRSPQDVVINSGTQSLNDWKDEGGGKYSMTVTPQSGSSYFSISCKDEAGNMQTIVSYKVR